MIFRYININPLIKKEKEAFMSIIVAVIVAALVVLFAALSLLPAVMKDSEQDSLVQFRD